MSAYAYMTANKPRGVIYIGSTTDLKGRLSEHRHELTPGFTSKYNVKMLVWYERHYGIESARQREVSLKRYRRDWKINLIESFNPTWENLFEICYEMDNLFVPKFEQQFEKPMPNPDLKH